MTAADVEAAAEKAVGRGGTVAPAAQRPAVGRHWCRRVYLKREDLQPVRSYKVRGAYNLMAQLPPEQRAAGVVCASAGNHAQGVALSCQLLGIRGHGVPAAHHPAAEA